MNLFDRMKLPFRKNKEFLSALYDILGFYPHDLEIYRVAFSHKSLNAQRSTDGKPSNGKGSNAKGNGKDRRGAAARRNERRSHNSDTPTRPLNNERLEYLGDAVLEAVVSDILFRHFSHKREGFLTSTRSKIVQREALNQLAEQMGLEKLILAAQGTRMSHTNIGGNAFEALMGAIYLDRGYKHCHWFITNRIIGHYVDLDNVAQKEVNFKSKLLEWSQKNRINISFKDSSGDKGFHTVVIIEGITIARGDGRSKKESQQEASKEALTRMRCEPKTYDNIFRAKEKRTAMEAEESFALPKIDEIESDVNRGKKQAKAAPVLEPKAKKSASDAAYDTAYDEKATFEVIDTVPEPEELTLALCEEKGLPEPPQADELREADEKLRKKHQRNRGAKTMGDAVKGATKGATSAEEKAEKREAERLAEVERQRAKAERKRKEKETEKLNREAAEEEPAAKTELEEARPQEVQPKEAEPKEIQPKEVENKEVEQVEQKEIAPKEAEREDTTPELSLSEEQKIVCHETEQEHEVEQALMEADSQEFTAEVAEQLATELVEALVDSDVEESIEAAELSLLNEEEELLPTTPIVAAPEEEDLIIAKDIAPIEKTETQQSEAEEAEATPVEVEENSEKTETEDETEDETEVETEEEVASEEINPELADDFDFSEDWAENDEKPQPANKRNHRRRGRRKKSGEGKPKSEGEKAKEAKEAKEAKPHNYSQPKSAPHQGKPAAEKQNKKQTEGEKPAKSKNTHRRNYNQQRRRGGQQ